MRRWSWCASRTAWTRSSARTCPSAWPSTAQRAPSSARPWKGAPRTGWRAGLWRRRASRRSQLPSSTRKTTAAAVLLVGRQTACARAATCTDSRVRRTTRCATLRRRAAPSQRTWCCRCCLAWTATTSRAPTRRGRRASCTTPCAAAPCAADTKWREKGGGRGKGLLLPSLHHGFCLTSFILPSLSCAAPGGHRHPQPRERDVPHAPRRRGLLTRVPRSALRVL